MVDMPGMPKSDVENNAHEGGDFAIIMHAGDDRLPHTGRYLEINRPDKLVFSWVSHCSVDLGVIVFAALSLLDSTYVKAYGNVMSTLTASEARAKLYRLIDEAAESHVPIQITGKRNNAILVSEKDWASVQETMYLLSVPGMRESIREGMESPVEECEAEIDW